MFLTLLPETRTNRAQYKFVACDFTVPIPTLTLGSLISGLGSFFSLLSALSSLSPFSALGSLLSLGSWLSRLSLFSSLSRLSQRCSRTATASTSAQGRTGARSGTCSCRRGCVASASQLSLSPSLPPSLSPSPSYCLSSVWFAPPPYRRRRSLFTRG